MQHDNSKHVSQYTVNDELVWLEVADPHEKSLYFHCSSKSREK